MSSRGRLHIFVLVDALGWRLVEDRNFLPDLLPWRRPLRTVLGFSSAAIPTILTGLPPAQTGHWNLFYFDPEGSPFRWLRPLRHLPDWVVNRRVVRKLLTELGRGPLGLGPLFECCVSPRLLPWFNWVEQRNLYDRGGIAGADSIFDQLSEKGIPYRVYSYHRWNDREIFKQAREDLQAGKARFFFLYLSELDLFLHNNCKEENRVGQRLGWYAERLRELYEVACKLHPDTCLSVLSDHGMTPVRRHYDLVKDVEALAFAMPRDYLAVYDSTMARFWFFAAAAQRAVTERLKVLPCGRILTKEELWQLGVFFPDGRYGELIFLLHPGWLLSRSDFNGRGWMPAGMHGYHPDDPDSQAVFLSNRTPHLEVRTIADVYQVMRNAAREVTG